MLRCANRYNFNDLSAATLRSRWLQRATRPIMVNMTFNRNRAASASIVHWPFCLSKCPYCDFNSHVRHGGVDEARFVRAFAAEIAADRRARSGPHGVDDFLRRRHAVADAAGDGAAILDAIAKHWTIAPDVEVTLEANPTSVEATRFRGYRAAGVNRVSLGVQALDDAALKELGRLHTRAGGARRGRGRALDLRALLVRSDLCAARARRSEAWAAELKRAHRRSRRASVALSTHHRAGHAVLRRCTRPASWSCPTTISARDLYDLTQDDLRRRRPAGLRDFQPRAAGRRVPAQPGLLARPRICRHRPGRAWPAQRRRPPLRHRNREAAGKLADAGRGRRPRPDRRRDAHARRAGRRISADGPAARRRHRARALRGACRPRRSIRKRIAILREEGAVETTADGRLRVTQAGFPVLDAVVADLAA